MKRQVIILILILSLSAGKAAAQCDGNLTAVISGGSSSVCYNSSPGTFTATGVGETGSYTYLWYKDGVSTGITTQTYDPGNLTTTSSFYCEISSGTCLPLSTSTSTVIVYTGLTAGISGGSSPICNNSSPGTFTATGGGGSGIYTYLWYRDGASTLITAQTYDPGPLTSTSDFYCAITSGSCGTVNTSTRTITVHGNLSVSISGGSSPVCYNTSPGVFTASASGGGGSYTYLWYRDGASTGITTQTYSPGNLTAPSSFYCRITTGSCGVVNTNTTSVTINPAPTLSGAFQASEVCSGSPATINLTGLLSGSTSTVTYNINGTGSVNVTGVIADGSGSASFSTAALLSASNGKTLQITGITVTGATPNCPGTFAQSLILIVNTASVPSITGNAAPCINSTGNVYTTEPGMTGYLWIVSAGGTVTAGGTSTNNSVSITWNTAGAQTVRVNYTNTNGCAAAAPFLKTVSVNPLPAPGITGPASACVNSTGNVYTTEAGMPGYTWTVVGGTITSGGNGSNLALITWTSAGTQSVSVNYPNNSGCTIPAPAVYNVTVNALPVPVITGPAAPRVTSSGNVYSAQPGMSGYIWTISAGGTKTAGGTSADNSVSVTWNTASAQSVSVNFANASNCTAASTVAYNVTVNSLPSATGVYINEAPAVGTTLTGHFTYDDVFTQGTSTFRWLRNGTDPISGATNQTYTLVSGDVDKTITFEVTPVSLTGPPYAGLPVKSAPTATVEDLTGLPVADEVCIEGIRVAGNIIRGKYRYNYTKGEGTSTYRWLRNNIPIPGAAAIQYTLKQVEDIDSEADITFEVTPVSSNHTPRIGIPVKSNPLARIILPKVEYSVSESDVPLVANVSGGVFSGSGISNGIFSPGTVGSAGSPYTLGYLLVIPNSSHNCSQQASKQVIVNPNVATFTGINPVYCHDSGQDIVTVSGVPAGAAILGFTLTNPAGIISQSGYSVTIDPGMMNPGNNVDVLSFSYNYNSIFYRISQPLVIDKVGTEMRILNLDSAYCKDDPKKYITVENVYPPGGTGTWTGDILSDLKVASAYADPASGTAGQKYPITYRYKSALGCYGKLLSQDVVINAMPDPSFALNPTYNIDGERVTLVPVQSGGAFSGLLVSGDILIPGNAGTGEFEITYNITDTNNCFKSLGKKTLIRKAQGIITDIPSDICYSDTTYNAKVTGLPVAGVVMITGFTNTKNTIIFTPGSTNADYNVPAAGEGPDTLFFSYKWDSVDYSISKPVLVDSLGQVRIIELSPGQIICDDNAPIELNATLPNGVFTGPVTGVSLDPTKARGDTSVSYTYTNQKTGCFTSTTVPITIYPAPKISFLPVDVCIDNDTTRTYFTNTTTSVDSVNSWLWLFSEPVGGGEAYGRDASHLYTSGGLHKVTLTAKTINNCSATRIETVDLGRKPKADFYWKNDCMHLNDVLILRDTSVFTSAIISQSWSIFDKPEFSTDKYTTYPKTATGYLKIQYVVRTSYANCYDTVIKDVYIRPAITIPSDGYFQNFETGDGGWVKGETAANNWSFGTPDRPVINKASSGVNAWFTRYDMTRSNTESSSIVSPCFDFRNTDRPMIKLKLWKRFEKERDGAALQYKIGDSKEWQYVGTLNDGINWFNSAVIKGRPGGDQLGWTTLGTPDENWVESNHTLDPLKGKSDVKFRIAYGSDPNYSDHDGIAFDDIWIGVRKRHVLVEHFTNNSSQESKRANAMVNSIVLKKNEDVINIQYHTNFPGSDIFYNDNPSDASARILFYGLTKAPYTFIDGGTRKDSTYRNNNFANIFDYVLADIDSNDVTRRSLINPRFDVSINASVSDSVLTVNGTITSLENINSDNLTLFLAVTEKENRNVKAANGENVFYNVFRKFIPDAGGTVLKKTWTKGETITLPARTWRINKIKKSADIEVVAFIQNSSTKELYQASSDTVRNIVVGIEDFLQGKKAGFTLYPNPATDRLTVKFGEMLKSEADISIYDVRGIIVRSYKAGTGESEFRIENPHLQDGIYLVRVLSGGIDFGFRKLIISGS
jgi:hypothetical protein